MNLVDAFRTTLKANSGSKYLAAFGIYVISITVREIFCSRNDEQVEASWREFWNYRFHYKGVAEKAFKSCSLGYCVKNGLPYSND